MSGEELAQAKARPGVVEHGQAAVIQGLIELALLGGHEVLPFEGGGDEIAGGRRQVGDVADGAGAWTAGVRKDSRTR